MSAREAAARAIQACESEVNGGGPPWDELPRHIKDWYRLMARRALQAAGGAEKGSAG